jgi:hypothetical protein
MTTGHKILLVVGCTMTAAVLGFFSEYVKNSLIDLSSRQGFGFGLGGLGYIIAPLVCGFFAFALSVVLVNVDSASLNLLISALTALFTSIGNFQSAYQILKRSDYFDSTYFKVDIFDICANFVIYLVIGFLILFVKKLFEVEFQKK